MLETDSEFARIGCEVQNTVLTRSFPERSVLDVENTKVGDLFGALVKKKFMLGDGGSGVYDSAGFLSLSMPVLHTPPDLYSSIRGENALYDKSLELFEPPVIFCPQLTAQRKVSNECKHAEIKKKAENNNSFYSEQTDETDIHRISDVEVKPEAHKTNSDHFAVESPLEFSQSLRYNVKTLVKESMMVDCTLLAMLGVGSALIRLYMPFLPSWLVAGKSRSSLFR